MQLVGCEFESVKGKLNNHGKEKEGEELPLARCSDCLNLEPDNWCAALRRTVPGTRHARRCAQYRPGRPLPLPVRPGRSQHPGLVRCVNCLYFAGWGLCAAGHGDLVGELGSRIWRGCYSYSAADPTGACSTCAHLRGSVCLLSGFHVTQSESPTACRKHVVK